MPARRTLSKEYRMHVATDGLPWLRLVAVLVILASLFAIPMVSFWRDGRRERRQPPAE
jgi:hypothetical protein